VKLVHSFAWMISLWGKYVTQYLLYKLIYDDFIACMAVVYELDHAINLEIFMGVSYDSK